MNNKDLAIEVVNFLDGVKEIIENNLKINFAHLENDAVSLVSDDEEECSDWINCLFSLRSIIQLRNSLIFS